MENTVYRGKLFNVKHKVVKRGEKEAIYEIAERAPGVRILFVNQNNEILLSREYREELKDYDYRLPGGKVFDSLDEYDVFIDSGADIEEKVCATGKKESKEETGIQINEIDIIYVDTLGATVRRDLYYLLAKNREGGVPEPEDGEDISTDWYSLSVVKEFLKTKKISESRTRAFLYDHFDF